MTQQHDASIPDRMKHLERDPRGYPIPWGVYRDGNGRPHFQINHEARRGRAMRDDLCPMCGKPLWRGRWFVGGPMAAFHPLGAYADPPMHAECARYALAVCPYLAAPHYGRRIDDKTLKGGHAAPLLADWTMVGIGRRPEVFVCAMATGQKITPGTFNIIPRRPFVRVEYWQRGRQLAQQEGEELVAADRLHWDEWIGNMESNRSVRIINPNKRGNNVREKQVENRTKD